MLTETITGILFEGMKLWNEKRRDRFMKKHHKILEKITNAQNETYPDYNDARLNLAEEELENFLTAYYHEIKKEVAE